MSVSSPQVSREQSIPPGRPRRRASFLVRLWRRRRDLPVALCSVGWLFLAWMAIDVLPCKLYRKMLKPSVAPQHPGAEQATALVQRVAWAVTATANRVPWRAVCFHQGIAAQRLLCRAGIPAELHYGVAKSFEKGLEAHVWVVANGVTVVGGKTRSQFTLLGVFAEEIPTNHLSF